MAKIFAITTRGLEDITAEEMNSISGLTLQNISYRKVFALHHTSLHKLKSIRTADDLFIEVGNWHPIAPQRSGLSDLSQKASNLRLEDAVEEISQIRYISPSPLFSVTASFVGKRNYTTSEIKHAIASGICSKNAWQYSSDDQISDINIRIFIEHEVATVGIRIYDTSLQKRKYKQSHTSGSLKPPVAAAMIFLAHHRSQMPIVDPFCGAGTILIEASQMGYNTFGGDISNTALRASQENAFNAGMQINLHCWDAIKLPLGNQSIETIVTNIPWGYQIEVGQDIHLLHQKFFKEIERVLIGTGKAVVLTSTPNLTLGNLIVFKTVEISLFGQRPTIFVLQKPE